MSLRRMMMFTLGGNLILSLIKNLKDFITVRTLQLGTTFEAESCIVTDLTDLDTIDLLSSATMILTPNNSSETEIIQVLPLPTNDIRNLLYRSEGSTTSWSTLQVTQAVVAGTSPTGEPTVIKMTEAANTNSHYRNQGVPNFIESVGSPFVWSCYLKKGDGAGSPDIMQLGFSNTSYANFNIVTGVSTASGGGVTSTSITDAGNGWWRCAIIGNCQTTGIATGTSSVYITFVNNNPTATRLLSYLGAINRNTFMFGAQFELGTSLTPYQKIETHPQNTNKYTYFGNTSIPYRTDSNGLLTNSPYENLIYPSTRISSVANGNIWRWVDIALNRTYTGLEAPDGTLTGSIIRLGGTVNNNYYLTYLTSGGDVTLQSFPTSRIRTLILYVKKQGTEPYLGIRLHNGTGGTNYDINTYNIKIDCSNGTLANNPTDYSITYTSQSAGNGWYKVCINCTTIWNKIYLQTSLLLNSTSRVDGQGVAIWGVQVVNGTVDINTPIYNRQIGFNIPRLDYSGSSCPEYLLESINYNTLLQSEDFTAANWIKTNVTVSSNTETAPNGELLADTLTATADFALVRQSGQANNSITIPRMFSVYLKRKTGTGDVIVDMGPSSATASLSSVSWTRAFVLAPTLAGTYTATAGAYTITTTLPHGFETGDAIRYDRLTGTGVDASIGSITVTGLNQFTFVNGTITSSGNCDIYSNTGKIRIQTNGDEVYAWGAQIESSLANTSVSSPVILPSSYIPTTTAQVTKQSDTTTTNFNGSSNCSLYFELSKNGGSQLQANPFLILGSETGPSISSDYLILFGGGINSTLFYKRENSGAVTAIQGPLPYNANAAYTKSLLTVSGNTIKLWMDGSQVALSTFANPSLLKYLTLGQNSGSTIRLKQLTGWDRTLSLAEAQALTSYNYPLYDAGYTPINSELQQIINRASFEGFTIPTPTQLGYCDILITEMKNDGVWGVSDVYFNFAYNDATLTDWSRINWKNPYGSLGIGSFNNGLIYNTMGIKGDNIDDFFNTNFNPSVSNYNYTLNNAGRFFVVSTPATAGTYFEGSVSATQNNAMRTSLGGEVTAHRINSTNSLSAAFNTSGDGLKSINRDDSNIVRIMNKSSTLSATQASNSMPNLNQYILQGISTGYCDAGIANYWLGASLNNTQVQNFRNYYNTYLVSIGLTAYA
jgi:hypothetical protein